MPFTYFAHQLMVVPLKWAKPRWFDGTALCVGSMAPDFAYAFEQTPLQFYSHNLKAQLLWTMPIALLLTKWFRACLAEPLGAQLPGALGVEVQALAHSRRTLAVTALSGLIGGLSHLFMDAFTHGPSWASHSFPSLARVVGTVAGERIHVWSVLQYLGHTLGSLLGLLLMAALVKRRAFTRWSMGLGMKSPLPWDPVTPAGSRRWGRYGLVAIPLGLLAATSGNNMAVAITRGSLLSFLCLALLVLLDRPDAHGEPS